MITADIGHVRIQDLDPFRIDAWLAQMRRDGVGEGAITARVGAMRSALSWGISRRMLRSNQAHLVVRRFAGEPGWTALDQHTKSATDH